MSAPVDPPPLSIPPPTSVRVAAVLVLVEAVALLAVAAGTGISGFRHGTVGTGVVLGQLAYYLVLAAALAGVAVGLLQGRRWARTPALVIQIITLGVGFYLAVPSGRLGWGVLVAAVAVVAGALLASRTATDWIKQFPTPFGLGEP